MPKYSIFIFENYIITSGCTFLRGAQSAMLLRGDVPSPRGCCIQLADGTHHHKRSGTIMKLANAVEVPVYSLGT